MRIGTIVVGVVVAASAAGGGAPRDVGPRDETRQASVSAEERAASVKRLREFERALFAIRARHFGSVRVGDLRKEGLRRVRETLDGFARPLPGEAISAALDAFEREAMDVRGVVFEYLAEQGTEAGDTALAWTACFDRDEEARERALGMVVARAERFGAAHGVKLAIDRALRSGKDEHAAAGARAAEALRLLEAIPLLITAQVSTGGATTDPRGVRAFILVGQQQTFVSGLTPVVGNNTVAFQPEMSTLTTGSLLIIGDSLVTSYRTEVHAALVRMTSEAWGRSTAYLGWDVDAWRRWRRDVFEPHMAAMGEAGMLGPRTP